MTTKAKAKKPGRPNKPVMKGRQYHYMKIAKHATLAIETLVHLMKYSKNENVKLGASKTIINKVIPDLKSTELKGSISPIQVQVLAGYVNQALSSSNQEVTSPRAGSASVLPDTSSTEDALIVTSKTKKDSKKVSSKKQ